LFHEDFPPRDIDGTVAVKRWRQQLTPGKRCRFAGAQAKEALVVPEINPVGVVLGWDFLDADNAVRIGV
jgi:hypothetical protein